MGKKKGKGKPKPYKWVKPSFEDIRFGFEVTMYMNHR
jgi:coenzyme PQQ precursor peptide PqqA